MSKKYETYDNPKGEIPLQWVPTEYAEDHPYYDPNDLGHWEVAPIAPKRRRTKWKRWYDPLTKRWRFELRK